MTKIAHKFLHFANYKDIPNWSVQYANEEDLGFTKKYPMAKIGSFLVKSRDVIEVRDDVEYKQVTIKINNGGVVPRNDGATLLGSKIGTKRQIVVHEGQFIMSKIDARNGAYGIIPKELEGAIVTNDFPVFDVDPEKIIPQFLVLISTTENFIEFARKCSSGTTNRKRIDIDAFQNQIIPLPSIKEQMNIVDHYTQNINQARTAMTLAAEKKASIESVIKEELGISQGNKKNQGNDFLRFTNLSDITVWSVDCISNKTEGILVSQKYNNVPMGKVVEINPKTRFNHLLADATISFIPMQSISEQYARWQGNDTCPISMSRGYTKFQEGDLIWAKITPCMQNGKSAVLKNLTNKVGCGSTEFYILRSHNNTIDIRYVHCLLRLPSVLNDATRHFTGSAGQQRVPVSYLKNLSIPVPPIEIQHTLVDKIDKIMIEVEDLINKFQKLEENAMLNFREKIFS